MTGPTFEVKLYTAKDMANAFTAQGDDYFTRGAEPFPAIGVSYPLDSEPHRRKLAGLANAGTSDIKGFREEDALPLTLQGKTQTHAFFRATPAVLQFLMEYRVISPQTAKTLKPRVRAASDPERAIRGYRPGEDPGEGLSPEMADPEYPIKAAPFTGDAPEFIRRATERQRNKPDKGSGGRKK